MQHGDAFSSSPVFKGTSGVTQPGAGVAFPYITKSINDYGIFLEENLPVTALYFLTLT